MVSHKSSFNKVFENSLSIVGLGRCFISSNGKSPLYTFGSSAGYFSNRSPLPICKNADLTYLQICVALGFNINALSKQGTAFIY